MIIYLIVATILGLIIGYYGRNKKMGFWGYLFGSILLTPIIGLILLLISGPKNEESTLKNEKSDLKSKDSDPKSEG
jgi:hypothetical protein